MEKCLESIVKVLNDKNWNLKDLNKYISYIVRSIPAPPNNCSISFPLAYNCNFVEIKPSFLKDMNISMDPFIILSYLNIENILILLRLLVFEQKILIVGSNINIISQIIINFLYLLYPFEWSHTCIPVMSEIMVKFLESFLPFFNGINTFLFEKIKKLQNFKKGFFIFNLDKGKFELSDNYELKSKSIKPLSYIEKNIKHFPKNLEELFLKELKRMKNSLLNNYNEKNRLNINLEIKNLFLQIFVEILYDYKDYSYAVEDYPLFNTFMFTDKKEKNKDFYKEFSSTQLFMYFVQNNQSNTNTYFEKRLLDFKEVKETEKSIEKYLKPLLEKFKNDYNNLFILSKKYVIKPSFMKNFEEFEKINLSKNKQLNYFDIVKFLLDNYSKPKFNETNQNGVLFENQRIFNGPIELTKDNDPEQLMIYYIPGQEKESEIIIDKKKQKPERIAFILNEEDYLNNRMSIIFEYKDYGLSEDDRDEIKDDLRELMAKIYKLGERKIDNEDKKKVIDSFKTQYGRDYFLSLLIDSQKEKKVKEIQNESFYFLSDVIFYLLTNILLFENDNDSIYAVKILKSCQYIKTTIKLKNIFKTHKKVIILSDELYNKLNLYPLLNEKRFWKIWLEGDMTESELNLKKLMKENIDEINIESNEFKSYEKRVYSLIYNLICIMMKMKIIRNSIHSNIQYLSNEYLQNEDLKKRLEADVLGQLQVYKNYSGKKI